MYIHTYIIHTYISIYIHTYTNIIHTHTHTHTHMTQALDIGRLYAVSANDNLHAIAKRYGTPLHTLYQLNNDLRGEPFMPEVILNP
jgi:hypothetical protein